MNNTLTSVCFHNEDNVMVTLPHNNRKNADYCRRPDAEKLFRKINTYLMKKGLIKNNIVDLGAWIGDNTIPWAKLTSSTIYAIDPSTENCNYISALINENNVNNVQIITSAISDKDELLSTGENLEHCSFEWYPGNNFAMATSLDSLYQKGKISNIGYIHLDVEGMEFKVIKGSVNIINTFRPIITFEQHINSERWQDIVDFFTSIDYVSFMVNETMPHCRSDCRNFISFPKELESDIQNRVNSDIQTDALISV